MQSGSRVGTHAAKRVSARGAIIALGVLSALGVVAAGPARAVDEDEKAGTRPLSSPEVTDTGTLIDASKHGTVEAEIAPERESTAPPPSSAELTELLLGTNWGRGGFFIGVSGHYAFEVSDQIGGKRKLASSGGASMRLGLKHDRFWSTEFFGLWTSKFKDDGSEFYGWGVYFGERFYLTQTRLQPYLGANVGFLQLQGTNFDGKTFGFAPKFNLGLEFFLNDTVTLDVDVAYYYTVGAIKDSDFTAVSIGVNWF